MGVMYWDCNSYTITLVILVIGIQDLYMSKYKYTIMCEIIVRILK